MISRNNISDLNEDDYFFARIRLLIQAGFCSLDEVQEMIEEEEEELTLNLAILTEFNKKRAAEESWQVETDCDRLDQAFETLDASDVIAFQNISCCWQHSWEEVEAYLDDPDFSDAAGYCFYPEEATFEALDGNGLDLAFGAIEGDEAARRKIANFIVGALAEHGFDAEWNGGSETRIHIHTIDWKRRSPKRSDPEEQTERREADEEFW